MGQDFKYILKWKLNWALVLTSQTFYMLSRQVAAEETLQANKVIKLKSILKQREQRGAEVKHKSPAVFYFET